MKGILAAGLLLILAAVGGTLAYQATRAGDYRELLDRGDLALGRGATVEAIEAYSGAIALRPDSIIAHLRRGESYQQRDELDAAARDFRIAATLDPTAPRPLEALGDVLSARGRYAAAAEVYEARLALDDQSPRVAHRLAVARYRAGLMAEAIEAARHALDLDDELAETQYLLGLALDEQGERRPAVEAFERAVALDPGFVAAREELVDLYREIGRRADELAQLQLLAEIDEQPGRHIAVAEALARSGRREFAVLSLANAIERSPGQPVLYAALGKVWLGMAEDGLDRPASVAKALDALGRAVAAPGAGSEASTLYARALVLDGQEDAAERALQLATRRFPVMPDAFGLTAFLAERRSRAGVARIALTDFRALLSDADFASASASIARFSLVLDEPDAAALWLERAAEARPADASLAAELADAQLRAGRLEQARATLAGALEKHPGDVRLASLLVRAGS